jgi:hypothetical protein
MKRGVTPSNAIGVDDIITPPFDLRMDTNKKSCYQNSTTTTTAYIAPT